MEYNRPNIESSALPLAHCVRLRIGSFALINEKRIGSPLIRGNNFNGYNFANVEPFPGFLSPHRALFNLRVNTKNRRKKKKEERKRDSTKRRLDTTGPYSRNLYERRERYESSSPGVCNCAIRQRERELGFRSCCYSQSRNRIWPPVRFARTIREFCVGRDYENVDVDKGRGRHFRDCA